MPYIIMKSTRLPTKGSFKHGGYAGPACADAGVSESKIYDDLEEAKVDAGKLSECNPIGFDVWDVDEKREVE